MKQAKHRSGADDAEDWDAVEQATELLQEQRFHEALYALRDAIHTRPRNPYAYYFLGTALFETAEAEAARDAFRAALRLSPDYLGARVALAQTLRVLGDLRGAIHEAEEALRRHPGDADALYAAGLAHAARGDRQAARRLLGAFLTKGPELEVASEAVAILRSLDGDAETEDADG